MINLAPVLREKYQEQDSKILELQFDGMYAVLSGANSPASLASRPIRYLFMDEVDKYPVNAGKEADPRSLARERTKTFAHNKKIFQNQHANTEVRPDLAGVGICRRSAPLLRPLPALRPLPDA
jgi:phage terminase large subunit GpA-like protein